VLRIAAKDQKNVTAALIDCLRNNRDHRFESGFDDADIDERLDHCWRKVSIVYVLSWLRTKSGFTAPASHWNNVNTNLKMRAFACPVFIADDRAEKATTSWATEAFMIKSMGSWGVGEINWASFIIRRANPSLRITWQCSSLLEARWYKNLEELYEREESVRILVKAPACTTGCQSKREILYTSKADSSRTWGARWKGPREEKEGRKGDAKREKMFWGSAADLLMIMGQKVNEPTESGIHLKHATKKILRQLAICLKINLIGNPIVNGSQPFQLNLRVGAEDAFQVDLSHDHQSDINRSPPTGLEFEKRRHLLDQQRDGFKRDETVTQIERLQSQW
jgi:hypothetical protein